MFRTLSFIAICSLIGGAIFAVYWHQLDREKTAEVKFQEPDLRQRRFDRAVEKIQADDISGWSDIEALIMLTPTFPPAHHYIVDHLLSDQRWLRSPKAVKKLKFHLEVIARDGDVDAKLKLAKLAEKKNHVEAIRWLRQLVNVRPDTHAFLARMLMREGRYDEATELAERTIKLYRERLSKGDDSEESRLSLAENLGLVGRFDEAASVLQESVQMYPDVHKPMMQYFVQHIDTLIEDEPIKTLSLLQDAARIDPKHRPIWQRLIAIIDGDHADAASQANDFLEDAAENVESGGAIELSQGIRARGQSDFNAAIEFLNQAAKAMPDEVDVQQHLAICLAYAEPPELAKALEISNRLVVSHPTRMDLLADRGRILALMERDIEAVADLEQGIRVLFTDLPIESLQPYVDTLSLLYRRAGKEHRAMALQALVEDRHRTVDVIEGHRLTEDLLGPVSEPYEPASEPPVILETEVI